MLDPQSINSVNKEFIFSTILVKEETVTALI
jgi:hypothetical protein